MRKKLFQTSASYPLGISSSKNLFKIENGEYIGRQVMVVQTSPQIIKLTYADKPYNSWATAVSFITDSADLPCDTVMDSLGNLYVIYTNSSNNLIFVKLTFTDGSWSAGSPVTVYNANEAKFPSIVIESTGKLWVGWTKVDTGTRFLCVKSSTDDGANWGSGPADDGDVISTGASSVYSKLVLGINDLYAIWVDSVLSISMKSYPLSGGNWSTKQLIGSGSELDSNFDVALSQDGKLGVVFDDNKLYYREYDSANWSALVTIDTDEGFLPQLFYKENVPYVIYTVFDSSEEYQLKYVSRKSGMFSTPVALDDASKKIDAVILYDTNSSTYADLTSEAASVTIADIFHSASNSLLENEGDILYLGMNKQFRYLYVNLFTSGVGGTVNYSYWDGSNWRAFTPASGNFNFDSSEKKLLLWDDYLSLPQDWQKSIVNSADYFWIKITATTNYSTPPIGSKITSITDIHALTVRR